MAYFSTGLELAATIYIQANSLAEAQTKLDRVLSKTIDARDGRWFSDVSFGSDNLPEISFATAMAILQATPGEECKPIEYSDVRELMRSMPHARKSKAMPRSPDCYGEGITPIYWADLSARTTGILKTQSLEQANALLSGMKLLAVQWECAFEWFELKGLRNQTLPLILSPNISIVDVSEGCKLRMRWAEEDDDAEDTREYSAVGAEKHVSESDFEVMSSRVKSHFISLGGRFATLSDKELSEITAFLFDHHDRRVGVENLLGEPISLQREP